MFKFLKISCGVTVGIFIFWLLVPLVWAQINNYTIASVYLPMWRVLIRILFSGFGLSLFFLPVAIVVAMWVYASFLDPEIQEIRKNLEEETEEAKKTKLDFEFEKKRLAGLFKQEVEAARKEIRAEEVRQLQHEKNAVKEDILNIEKREAQVEFYLTEKKVAEKNLAEARDSIYTLFGTINGARRELEKENSDYALKILSRKQKLRKRPSKCS